MYSFSRPFTAHHYCTLCLSHWCVGVEKKICKETMHYHHLTYMAHPCTRIRAPGFLQFTNLVDPSLIIYNVQYTTFIWIMLRRSFQKKLISFTPLSKNYLPLGWSVIEFTISCFLSRQKLKIGSAVLEKKIITDDARCMTIAIGHLS